MKKLLLTVVVFSFLVGFVAAQESKPNASQIGVDSAQQKLQEESINKFEDTGFWNVTMPLDQGVITTKRFEGGPAAYNAQTNPTGKQPIAGETASAIAEQDKYVLGVKVEFYGRANTTISVQPSRPLPVPGICKTISVWVVGRNFNHDLYVMVEDAFGNKAKLPMGTLNFSGWKQLTVAVPGTLVQKNAHYANRLGIKILGFIIEPELTETYGTYYVYFDDLRVVTDLFTDEIRDTDDIQDTW